MLPALLVGCVTPTDEAPSDSADALTGGGRSGANQDAVVRILHDRNSVCSGTRIAPNVILTARHCVGPREDRRVIEGTECNDQGEPNLPELIEFDAPSRPGAFDLDIETTRTRSEDDVVAVLVKKGKPFHCGYDVALLVLSNEASELLARNPIAKLRRSDPKTGESLVAVGFGVTSSGEPASTRQQRPVRVVATQPTRLRDPKPDGTSDDAGVGLGEFATTEGPCRGDSGGPALMLRARLSASCLASPVAAQAATRCTGASVPTRPSSTRRFDTRHASRETASTPARHPPTERARRAASLRGASVADAMAP
jgi:hypothetical protein